ncbi:MAG: DUF1801 domain-containing protein [Pseudomonadota bacterium]
MLDDHLPAEIEAVFQTMPAAQAAALLAVRSLILSEAAALKAGPVSEALKWGQPSYSVAKGTPIRLGLSKGRTALFVHCQTSIIEPARELFGGVAEFEGSRALILGGDPRATTYVIRAALTYKQPGKRV